tara:strand:- start:266 stop:1906 length:1641 start_codon:yes stop_codon:yes gene_type:complete
MAYVPKSKISYRISNNNEFITKKNKQEYNGPYISVEDKKYYIGSNYNKKGPELIKRTTSNIPGAEKNFNTHIKIRNYNKVNSSIRSRLQGTVSLPVAKSYPTELNYSKGKYTRYFAKRFNGYSYLEIDYETYQKIREESPTYDYNLWEVGSLEWHLTGNVFKKNSISIKEAERTSPRVFYLFPIINEFFRPDTVIITDQYTNGGELYYNNGSEYVGSYHIHPVLGPMIGADHLTSQHEKIYYLNQLPTPTGTTYEDFVMGLNKQTCYKCVTIRGRKKVVSNQRSNLLGCPPSSVNNYQEAADGCFPRKETLDKYDDPNIPDKSRPDSVFFPIDGGDPHTTGDGNTWPPTDYSGFGTWGSTGGYGGGSGGGGGGSGGGGTSGTFGGGTCFVPNTLITMADNSEKMISTIKIGDKVKSELGESTVTNIKIHTGDYTVYSLNNGKPFVTEEHPFKTIDGWKAINPITTLETHQVQSTTLDINDIVITLKGNQLITMIEEGKTKYPRVYNISLDNEHVYYANGYLVHNDKTVSLDQLEQMHWDLEGGNWP